MDLSMVSKITTKLRHFFIPHEGNNFEPHLFRYGTIATVLAVSVFVFAVVVFGRLYVDTSGLRATVISSVVADLANSERVKESLPLLTYNTTLQAAAQMKANDMSAKNYFAHTSPEGFTPWFWFGKAGYLFYFAGENLAVDFDDSDAVTRAWMKSPTHKANILNGKFTEIGVATAEGTHKGHKTTYVVQMFGTPAIVAPLQQKVTPSPAKTQQPSTTPTIAPIRRVALAPAVKGAETEQSTAPVTESPQAIKNQDFISVQASDPALVLAAPDVPAPALKEGLTPSVLDRMIIDPGTLMTIVYLTLATIVVVGILFRITIEYRRHHMKHVLLGVLSLVFMVTLYTTYHFFFPSLQVMIQ
jgi:hypothetical protein